MLALGERRQGRVKGMRSTFCTHTVQKVERLSFAP
jgi:hypothetical protein